jgi:hypothetical protein
LILKPRYKLQYFEKDVLDRWLNDYPELKELYWAREALFGSTSLTGAPRSL